MSQKPTDSGAILQFIIFAGVILDSYSVYGFWKELNDNKSINTMIEKNGLATQDLDIASMVSTLQRTGTLLLLAFLIFDFLAYYYLSDYKNWARKYIMSIAAFYLIGCFFNFSIFFFLYGAFTLYYLYKNPQPFLRN